MSKVFYPKIITTIRNYTREQFLADLIAGVIVGVVVGEYGALMVSEA